jgi:NADH-quinone oxidoreductase subunit F
MAERPLTEHMRADGEPLDIKEYEKSGGYRALRKALKEMAPKEIVAAVSESGLRGRGGAGFPTGKKWSLMAPPDDRRRPRYQICNADEMEPGTFKDRILMEGNPHQLIEGMTIASYAVQADISYLFLRWAYKLSAARLKRAIGEAYDKGYLGKNIMGSGFSLELRLHVSAGRYMCGEETGLLNSLEGRRATPRARPPHSTTSGLWGKPTAINNVETLCNVPHIVANGAQWHRDLGITAPGTKLYGVSGRVKSPGAWELPMGTTMRELVEEHAGGMMEGYGLRAAIPGGASTEFVLEKDLDVNMDFDSVQKVGSRMGTGTMIVLDDRKCPVAALLALMKFFSRESCGWCTPCREGLPWIVEILEAVEAGRGEPEDIELLADQAKLLGPGHTFCLLAPGAMEPLGSGVKYFREDIERHIKDRRCPWKGRG